ncbi:MAG: DinB family protein [Chitinophagaceae bacterium]
MQPYFTTLLLEELETQTNSFLDEAIQQWQMMPNEKFSHQPAANAWSAKQCVAHLNSYGDYYLPAIEQAIEKAKAAKQTPQRLFMPGRLGNYFTNMMLPAADGRPVKKMKAFKKYIHPNNEDGDVVIATFIEQQEKMLQLLESAAAINLESTRVGISIAPFIKLKLGDVFRFIAAHNQRHIEQARRAVGSRESVVESRETTKASGEW